MCNHDAEMIDRILQTAFLPGELSQLIICIRFFGIDFDGAFESGVGLSVPAALLIDESELIVGFSVARINGAGVKVPAEALSLNVRSAYSIDSAKQQRHSPNQG